MSDSNHVEITSTEQFQSLLSADLERVSLLNFWAPWAEPCKDMNELVKALAKKYPKLLALSVEAETQADIAESFDIESVPAFIILRGHTLLSRIVGADAKQLADALEKHLQSKPTVLPLSKTTQSPAAPPPLADEETQEQLDERCNKLMNQSNVVLFMKGTPDEPRCGFSRRTVALLRDKNVEFTTFDILGDEGVRSRLKELNKWPTFPQVIVKGELVGGLDIVTEMVESGEWDELLKA